MDVPQSVERIEVAAGDYVVAVLPSDLPEQAQEMVDLLMGETAPLSTWIDVAKAYLAEGKEQQYEHVLRCVLLHMRSVLGRKHILGVRCIAGRLACASLALPLH